MTGRPAVFLDRDGVINEATIDTDGRAGTPLSPDDVIIVPGAATALRTLSAAGFVLVVVTNQPDVSRGRLTPATLEAIHAILRSQLPLDAIVACPHDSSHACDCRKPKPGMLRQATKEFGLDLAISWLVGDRWVDIAAGRAAGVSTVLIDRPWSWQPTSQGAPPRDLAPDGRAPDLATAVDFILTSEAR